MKKLIALLLCLVMVLGLAACGGDNNPTDGPTDGPTNGPDNPTNPDDPTDPAGSLGYTITENDPNATYTSRQAWSTFPTQWNPHNYRDDTASDVLDNMRDYLYDMMANDELHNPDGKEPWTGYTIVPLMAADYPTDVTAEVKAAHPDWIPESATSGYAWSIPLREDLYFDTGYHITADTFVQSIQYLLDPRLQNYRASDFYQGSGAVVGAEDYALQGMDTVIDNGNRGLTMDDFTKGDDGVYTYNGDIVYIAVGYPLSWCSGHSLADYVGAYADAYFGMEHWDELAALADDQGMVPCTDENLALLSTVTTTNPNWGETDADLPNYLVIPTTMPDGLDFAETVGYYAQDEYTLVMVFKTSFDPDFFLYYNGLNSAAGWLIEPEVYEKCMSQDEAGAWHTTYMTSVETSPSFGAFSMTDFQTDKHMAFARNEKWYGWHDDVNHVYKDPNDGNVYRTIQTTNIDCQIVTEDATRLNMFLMGQLSGYGLQPADYDQFGHSEFLHSTPGDAAYGLWLTGNLAGLQARENAGDFDKTKQDLETITVLSFRKAMAVSFDRQRFCDEVNPAQVPAFGMLGTLYIYDPDTGASYRASEPAMQALCDFYSVDVSKFDSLEEAAASITGFDLDAAKTLYQQAFEESLELGYITDADNDGKCDQTITLVYSTDGPINDNTTRQINYFNNSIAEATAGTPFEGKIVFAEGPQQNSFLDPFMSGAADWFVVGLTGSSLDPYNGIAAFGETDGSTFITPWYDPTSDMLTLTVQGEEITMSVADWCYSLNGEIVTVNGKNYSFGRNDLTNEERLPILAGIEGKILAQYNDFPLANQGSKSLLSQQMYYTFDEYVNLFVGFGYTRYQYTDAEWEAYCNEQIAEHGSLQY